jgi:hypothetical protein
MSRSAHHFTTSSSVRIFIGVPFVHRLAWLQVSNVGQDLIKAQGVQPCMPILGVITRASLKQLEEPQGIRGLERIEERGNPGVSNVV